MDDVVVALEEIDPTQVAMVGGKGAHLGALTRLDGVRVPAGFCVTTDAFRRFVAGVPGIDVELDGLAGLPADDAGAVRTRSAEIRAAIEATAIPDDVAAAITAAVARLGERGAYAVRSSATAEDLPTASFAGQHDTALHVVGASAVLAQVRRCWASSFTERAFAYRVRNGIDHRAVLMAVVVQRMVVPDASGVLFTADPVSGDRTVSAVEATVGLGEALVSGRVNPEAFAVRAGEIVSRSTATERPALHSTPTDGDDEAVVDPQQQVHPALTDAQVLRLVQLGRHIESHLGGPQDIEWCLADDGFEIVQSRPITTLFPVPVPAVADGATRVYVSVGHQQMMTDPMKPLGLSVFQLTALRPMFAAGGRLFVDVTDALASPASRDAVVEGLGRSDPLIGDALRTLVAREGFLPPNPGDAPGVPGPPPVGPAAGAPPPIETDPAIVSGLVERNQASVAALQRAIAPLSGTALVDLVLADIDELKRLLLDPLSVQVVTAAFDAAGWLNERLEAWLGERGAADTLTRSVPHNVTSEMGLALLDVADVIRPHPDVVAALAHATDDSFLDELDGLAGGSEARHAIETFLDRYGMRCVGEIDITRPRWRERPATLLPVLLGNIERFEPGEARARVERGRQEARAKEQELLERLRALPDGEQKADETACMIDRVRTFMGYREYPKYGIVSRYLVYKQALLAEAARLVQAGAIDDAEDIFFLTLAELRDLVQSRHVDAELIGRRRAAHRRDEALSPPRVLTSDGEVVAGTYRRDARPIGALVGLAVSTGTVEGRARVVVDLADADLEPGDILVTAYTDPSWSPLFIAAAGLVTEVGGLMTHGAVVAREYGLPAVVGVEHATRRIRDGQRIRVHGTDGYVEVLPELPIAGPVPPAVGSG